MSENQKKKEVLKKLLKEEVSPSQKREIEKKLSSNVEKLIDHVLVGYDVHKKGLSEQQAAYIFHKLVKCIDEKLDEFKSKKQPSNIQNFEQIIDQLDI